VLQKDVQPEVAKSPALSLFARPGDGGVRARRVAMLVADGVDGDRLRSLADRLTAAGAVPRFVGSRFGAVSSISGDAIEVDVTMEAAPSVLFDAIVLPDGKDAVKRLTDDARTLEFLKDQYRHCKPILALGAASALLEKADIPAMLPSGRPDPGLLTSVGTDDAIGERFVEALAKHRHFDRESDPPRI
jgi:catalase